MMTYDLKDNIQLNFPDEVREIENAFNIEMFVQIKMLLSGSGFMPTVPGVCEFSAKSRIELTNSVFGIEGVGVIAIKCKSL